MEQANLFPDFDPKPTPIVVDTEAIAAAGDRRNASYNPNAGQSEPHLDLGGGIRAGMDGDIQFSRAVEAAKVIIEPVIPTRSRNSLSPRGKLIADREPDPNDLAYQPPVILSPEENEYGKAKLAEIRGNLPLTSAQKRAAQEEIDAINKAMGRGV